MFEGAATIRDVGGASTIENVTVVEAEPAIEPVAVMVAVAVDADVGVPLITPVDVEIESPAGKPVAAKVTVPRNRDAEIAEVLVIAAPAVQLTEMFVGEIDGPT